MKTFVDAEGRTWEILVNVSTVKLVRTVLGVDLLEAAGGDLVERLSADPCLLVDVVRVLSAPGSGFQAVKPEEFERAMRGDVLDKAAAALFGELLDFFPWAQRAAALGKLVEALDRQRAAMKLAAESLGPLAGAAPAEGATPPAAELPPTTPGGSSGTLPASSGRILAG